MKKLFFTILTASLLVASLTSFSQITKIMGKVTDVKTGESLPMVNIYLKGTTTGVTSDFEGKFIIEYKLKQDTLIASCMGYEMQWKKVVSGKFQEINFELQPSEVTLSTVEIRPGENPAEILLKKIIKNKDQNNWEQVDYLEYEAYNKIQLDANNLSEEFKKRKLLRPFDFVFDYIDTSTVNGKPYLPLLLFETISDMYYRKSPRSNKEIIKASKTSGIDNESVSQYMGQMYQIVNVYDNFIVLFDKNFVSPISDFGLNYYKYYLVDSMTLENHWCYKVMFKPRRKQELTFTGNFWVADTAFAIKSIEVRIADDANLNFAKDLIASQEFNQMEEKYWVKTREQVVIDFNVFDNPKQTTGFFGHKTTSYKNHIINKPKIEAFYNQPLNVQILDDALKKPEEYWTESRHDTLNRDEKTIYNMIDSVKNIPVFKTWVDIIQMITTEFYVWGKVELGPYASTYSFNELEGSRIRFGGRTSNDFSTKWMVTSHVAYGTKDQKLKYGVSSLYLFSKNPRRGFEVAYKDDIEQLGQSQNAFREDFLLASIFQRNPINKLSMVQEYKLNYEHEWFQGLSNTLNFYHREIFPQGTTVFRFVTSENSAKILNSITSTEVRLDMRFAYKETFLMGEFERTSLGTRHPILEVQLGKGFKGALGGDYDYTKLQVNVKHWFNIRQFGWSKYIVDAGKIWGTLPYPLLKLHEGNETFTFDEYAFNTMNYYEFASDMYLSVYYTHHFDGYFLNHLPLMRKLKWREVIWGKGLIGDLSNANKNFMEYPANLSELSKPYFEAGAGIENIFKIFRVDAVWRLSYLDHPDINPFAIMISMGFTF